MANCELLNTGKSSGHRKLGFEVYLYHDNLIVFCFINLVVGERLTVYSCCTVILGGYLFDG